MTDYNRIFGFKEFSGSATKRQLRKNAEWTEEYKDYTISFGKAFHEDGNAWWKFKSGRTRETDALEHSQ